MSIDLDAALSDATMIEHARHRRDVTVTMEGIPAATATLLGWNARSKMPAKVQFQNGSTANVRADRITIVEVQ